MLSRLDLHQHLCRSRRQRWQVGTTTSTFLCSPNRQLFASTQLIFWRRKLWIEVTNQLIISFPMLHQATVWRVSYCHRRSSLPEMLKINSAVSYGAAIHQLSVCRYIIVLSSAFQTCSMRKVSLNDGPGEWLTRWEPSAWLPVFLKLSVFRPIRLIFICLLLASHGGYILYRQ